MSNPDLTQVLDVAELWPEPADCPAWPLNANQQSAAMNPPAPRSAAEQRLTTLNRALNGENPVREPTDDERQRLIEKHFTDEPLNAAYPGADWRYSALGLPFIRDRVPSDKTPGMIVEAAHLRGYLRKMDAKAERDAKAQAEAEQRRLQHKVEGFPERRQALIDELESLAEAEARHQQMLEDEKAAQRCRDLRQRIEGMARQAREAADQLGVELVA